MKFYVFWTPHVDEKFERLVREADQPDDLLRAAKELNHMLVQYPLQIGESRYDSARGVLDATGHSVRR